MAMAVLVSVSVSVSVSVPVAAQTQAPKGEHATSKNARVDRAKERCKLNHGVNCETTQGLKEWLLLDRSRKEAVLEGSRHLVLEQQRPPPLRP